jgi:hypothetical protein
MDDRGRLAVDYVADGGTSIPFAAMYVDQKDQVARETYSKLRESMDGIVDFGKQLVALTETPPDMLAKALQTVLDTLTRLSTLWAASMNARNPTPRNLATSQK